MGPDTKEYYELQSEYWFNECCKCTNACNELINDMADIKRKAEAFDEIKELVSWFEENDRYEFEGQVGKIIKIIKDLERGSDE